MAPKSTNESGHITAAASVRGSYDTNATQNLPVC